MFILNPLLSEMIILGVPGLLNRLLKNRDGARGDFASDGIRSFRSASWRRYASFLGIVS